MNADFGVAANEVVENRALLPTSSFAFPDGDMNPWAFTPTENSLFGDANFSSDGSSSMAVNLVTDPLANMLQL